MCLCCDLRQRVFDTKACGSAKVGIKNETATGSAIENAGRGDREDVEANQVHRQGGHSCRSLSSFAADFYTKLHGFLYKKCIAPRHCLPKEFYGLVQELMEI